MRDDELKALSDRLSAIRANDGAIYARLAALRQERDAVAEVDDETGQQTRRVTTGRKRCATLGCTRRVMVIEYVTTYPDYTQTIRAQSPLCAECIR